MTLAALVVAWLWAVAPLTKPLLYIHSTGWTDADLVKHVWRFRLIEPEWVSQPPQYDYLRWTQAEALARLSLVSFGWLAAIWSIMRSSRSNQPDTPPNKAGACNGAGALSLHVESVGRAVPDLFRSA